MEHSILDGGSACLLGVDAGTVRCGLAASDPSQTLASPVGVVPTQPLASLGARTTAQLGLRRPVGLVVGLPLDQHGGEGGAAQSAREIGDALAVQLGLEVNYVDERFTTRTAAQRRSEAGVSRKRQRTDIDAWAAAAILQSWLDRRSDTP